ncbi:hypothetical protein FM125_11195 [Micrococcus lylae]|uniref:Uncharacterized protein n=1 Tax=Micrococcus lylae TaxID=1273 RepID=A0A1R4JXK2_9MICC|nr:hypothetical protein FM125_11195 [Micrococcus lylae]
MRTRVNGARVGRRVDQHRGCVRSLSGQGWGCAGRKGTCGVRPVRRGLDVARRRDVPEVSRSVSTCGFCGEPVLAQGPCRSSCGSGGGSSPFGVWVSRGFPTTAPDPFCTASPGFVQSPMSFVPIVSTFFSTGVICVRMIPRFSAPEACGNVWTSVEIRMTSVSFPSAVERRFPTLRIIVAAAWAGRFHALAAVHMQTPSPQSSPQGWTMWTIL